MDITFKCPHCDQELEVDAAGAGSSFRMSVLRQQRHHSRLGFRRGHPRGAAARRRSCLGPSQGRKALCGPRA